MRPYDEEPTSRTALAARWIALFSVPVSIIAALASRSGRIETVPALAAVGSGLALAAVAGVLAFAAFAVIWVRGTRGGKAALLALLVSAAVLAYPAYVIVKGLPFPILYDITTDVADPPVFAGAAAERMTGENPLVYGGERMAIVQLAGYPDIVPVTSDLPVAEVHTLALQAARARGWRIIAGEAIAPGATQVRIEAVASSLIVGLKSDVAIRIRAAGRGSRIDMRAASRYGRRDFGHNASLIRDYLAEVMAATR